MPNFDINQRAIVIFLQAPTKPHPNSFNMIEGLENPKIGDAVIASKNHR
jgi:hypothetical protein